MDICCVRTPVITVKVEKMPSEETRKIVQIGNSLGVTLPLGWLRYNRLKAKDRVQVISNGVVVIRLLKPEKEKKRDRRNSH